MRILFFILVLFSSPSFAQMDSSSARMEQLFTTNKKGMFVLGSWAAGNITLGAIGMSRTDGFDRRFHEMNLFWNTVNLALAIPGRISAAKSLSKIRKGSWLPNADEYKKEQRKTERIFLFNTGLDILYMGTGLLMNAKSSGAKDPDRMKGYGNSIMLQGGFLFGFDAAMWWLHRRSRIKSGLRF